MKIGYTSITLPEGKFKYSDKNLLALAKKDSPKKISPFFAEFIKDEFIHSEAVVIGEGKMLDVLILDMEKLDARIQRTTDQGEIKLFEKCMEKLEEEIPLCEVEFSEPENEILRNASLISYKPVIVCKAESDINEIIKTVLEKAGYMFFYTSGPKESHAWLVKQNSTIVECAGKIHSDLARGFIRGDVVSFDDYLKFHNFNECKSKGAARVVEKGYIVQPNEVIEIRFNV